LIPLIEGLPDWLYVRFALAFLRVWPLSLAPRFALFLLARRGGLPLIAAGEFYPAVLCVRFAHFAPLRLLCSARYDKMRQKMYNQPS
jgi:hypothetical protein